MEKYANKYEEYIANRPYSTDWDEERRYVLHSVVEKFYDECTWMRTVQTSNDESADRYRIIFFEIYGAFYMYLDIVEKGLIEGAVLEKVMDLKNGISIVMYSNVENVSACAHYIIKLLQNKALYLWDTGLDKG